MRSVRVRKVIGDVRATWGRIVAMLVAFGLALAGVGIVLGARSVLGREIRTSFLSTRPADATLEMEGGVDEALLAIVRGSPGVEDADKRQVVKARVRVDPDGPWQMFVLFVADDFATLRLNTFRPETGAWPPPRGTILLERTAPAVMGVVDARALTLLTPHGTPTTIAIAGTVHDPGQAPNWQEHRGCGYATLETLAALGEPPALHELLVRFRSVDDIEGQAERLASALRASGHAVHEVRVPKGATDAVRQHPHQGLMNAVQLVLLAFSLVILVLCSILFATMLSAMLARQVREIGVMKAIGARTGQIAAMYAAFVGAIGVASVAIAAPLVALGAAGMIGGTARMMNLAVTSSTIPVWVWGAVGALGIVVPLAFAAVPILRATGITVRRALGSYGTNTEHVRPSRMPFAIRNALRRPLRTVFTMLLLVIGGAIVITAANLQQSLAGVSSRLAIARHFDLEIRLLEPISAERVASLAAVHGVRAIEGWSAASAALGDVVHTFPDGGHGGFQLVAPPSDGTRLVTMPLREGRWLVPDDTDAVVLGHGVARRYRLGDQIAITVAGRRSMWTLVGIVEEVGGGSAFVTEGAFRRATNLDGVNLLRIATGFGSPATVARHVPPHGMSHASSSGSGAGAEVLAALERELAGVPIYYAMPADLMRSIIDDHVELVVRAILVIASILALVGLIALGSAMGINVAERTRELGILKAIGATHGRIFRIIVGEALAIGVASSIVAILVGIPLTLLAIERVAGRGFIATPPFTVSYVMLAVWPLVMAAGSVAACILPARRAMRLSVREALGAQ
jgi:putative ABC transport system permease protein